MKITKTFKACWESLLLLLFMPHHFPSRNSAWATFDWQATRARKHTNTPHQIKQSNKSCILLLCAHSDACSSAIKAKWIFRFYEVVVSLIPHWYCWSHMNSDSFVRWWCWSRQLSIKLLFYHFKWQWSLQITSKVKTTLKCLICSSFLYLFLYHIKVIQLCLGSLPSPAVSLDWLQCDFDNLTQFDCMDLSQSFHKYVSGTWKLSIYFWFP